MNKLVKVGVALLIVTVGITGMIMLSSTQKESKKREEKKNVRTVETSKLKFGDHKILIEGNGLIESQKDLEIVSEATGRILFAKNNLKSGTRITGGEVLVEIDSREVKNTLYSLRSDLINTLARFLPELNIQDSKAYDNWYAFFSKLEIEKDLPALPETLSSQEKILISSREIYTKYFRARNQEILVSKYQIKAPFNGYITSNGLIENSYVSMGQKLFSASDVDNLEIAIPLLVEEIGLINCDCNPKVRIIAENNSEVYLEGRLVRKQANLIENSQTMNVYVNFRNPKLNTYFLPGNYVKVEIEGKMFKNVAKIPRHLITEDCCVYTFEEGKLNKRKINPVVNQKDDMMIKNTLPDETHIVTTILQKPLVGMELKSINEVALNVVDSLYNTSIVANK